MNETLHCVLHSSFVYIGIFPDTSQANTADSNHEKSFSSFVANLVNLLHSIFKHGFLGQPRRHQRALAPLRRLQHGSARHQGCSADSAVREEHLQGKPGIFLTKL